MSNGVHGCASVCAWSGFAAYGVYVHPGEISHWETGLTQFLAGKWTDFAKQKINKKCWSCRD